MLKTVKNILSIMQDRKIKIWRDLCQVFHLY